MGARLINNPRRTKIGHVEAFPVLHMRSLRKSAMFSEGQRTEGHFLYPGASNAITIIVDLRSEHDLKVLLEVGHTDSATNMQVIGLTHRPTGFHGRRWYFVSANGERAETLFLVEGFFRTRTEAGLPYRTQNHPPWRLPRQRQGQLLRIRGGRYIWDFCSGWAVCKPGKCWALSSGGLGRGFPNQEGPFSSLSPCATAGVRVP